MVNNSFTVGNGSSVSGVTLGSTVSDSVINAISTVDNSELKALLNDILIFLMKEKIEDPIAKDISEKIERVSKAPSKVTVGGLIEALKAVTTIGQGAVLISRLTAWVSSGLPL